MVLGYLEVFLGCTYVCALGIKVGNLENVCRELWDVNGTDIGGCSGSVNGRPRRP